MLHANVFFYFKRDFKIDWLIVQKMFYNWPSTHDNVKAKPFLYELCIAELYASNMLIF